MSIKSWTHQEDLEVATVVTLAAERPGAAAALEVARHALLRALVGIVIGRTLVLALLSALVRGALLADLHVETVAGTLATPRVTFTTDSLARQRLESALLLRQHPLVVVAVWTRLVTLQTPLLQHKTVQLHYFATCLHIINQ